MNVLATERLRLRRFDPRRDAPFVVELLNESAFIRHIADRGVRTEAEAEAYIREWALASYDAHGFGPLRVALREDDSPVGVCGLFQREHLDLPDLGFALLERHHGRGYAAEAAMAVMAHACDGLDLPALLAITTLDNAASIRLLVRLGFADEGEHDPGDGEAGRLFRWQPAEASPSPR